MKKLAIRFGDNDFGNCFRGLLKTLSNAYKYNNRAIITDKQKLCLIINELSYGHYLLFQNQFEYNEEAAGILNQHTKDYLQITPEKLMINEEVDKFLSENDWDNSETFIIDFTQNEPYIFSI